MVHISGHIPVGYIAVNDITKNVVYSMYIAQCLIAVFKMGTKGKAHEFMGLGNSGVAFVISFTYLLNGGWPRELNRRPVSG